ncbi:hypothetical protein KEM60_02051 [Austwickia sp. TVS 96-490-7B]|nr:hypothetical protein [Austwickia sp. TVS 96-490-7B]
MVQLVDFRKWSMRMHHRDYGRKYDRHERKRSHSNSDSHDNNAGHPIQKWREVKRMNLDSLANRTDFWGRGGHRSS